MSLADRPSPDRSQPEQDPAAERALNPRATVPNVAAIVEDWKARAAATRARRAFEADIAYGSHPRELVDVYPATDPKGTLVFIHGGYWRAFSKVETAWIVEGFVDRGYTVALPQYPLCPDVTLDRIVVSLQRCFAHLYRSVLGEEEREAIVVAGHSAGGHLTATLMATDWTHFGMPEKPFGGAASISGVFDLAPLRKTSINDAVRLTEASAEALSPIFWTPRVEVPLLLAVGGDESDEFHRQSRALADTWSGIETSLVDVAATNHFTVLDGLADQNAPLNRAVVDLIDRAGRSQS